MTPNIATLFNFKSYLIPGNHFDFTTLLNWIFQTEIIFLIQDNEITTLRKHFNGTMLENSYFH